MKFPLPRVALTTFALGVCASGFAQESVPIEYYRPLKNSVSVGVRMIGGKAKVGFSNLGNIPLPAAGSFTGTAARSYDNGAIGTDEDRTVTVGSTPGEIRDENGNLTATTVTEIIRDPAVNGRYQVRQVVTRTDVATSAVTTEERILSDNLEYLDGFSRNWLYNSAAQYNSTTGQVDMSNYGVAPSSGTADAESENGKGVELQFARVIKRYKRFEWGVNFSAGVSDINAKTTQQIRADLLTTTDRYNLRPGSMGGADRFNSTTDFEKIAATTTGSATGVSYEYDFERPHYLDPNGTRIRDGEVTPGAADVTGYWQIKGAYYLLRVGPTARFEIAKNWTVSVSAGAAGAFVGSRFIADEYITLPDVDGQIRTREEGEKKAFVGGYYADVNIERWLTVRTGFFLGYGTEKLGDYTQELRGRKAEIDLGSSSGFRFGIITRF
jgi:hypothetical protein